MSEATEILDDLSAGNRSKVNRLSELVYSELHQLAESFMRREKSDHVLQPTALVHEAFLRLIDQNRATWKSRSHFLAVGAQAMRRIVVDQARRADRKKRGGGRQRVELTDHLAISSGRSADVIAVDEAIEKLTKLNELQAKILEMRFFADMSVEEVAQALGISKRSVERQWTATRAWLRRELTDEDEGDEGDEKDENS